MKHMGLHKTVERLQELRDWGVEPRVRLSVERAGFLIKTVDCWTELEAALRLRHEVFHREQNGRSMPSGLDVDDIDFVCDHLVIIDGRTRAIAGTYRLTSTLFSHNFYASKRFELARFLSLPGEKLELGRACVDARYRSGATLHLLWRGIIEYAREAGARYLFGSASLRNLPPPVIRALYDRLLDDGCFVETYGVTTKVGCHAPLGVPEKETTRLSDEAMKRLVPPLFHSYLRAGARLCGEPALDPYMDSIDFLTILDLQGMTRRFARRYQT